MIHETAAARGTLLLEVHLDLHEKNALNLKTQKSFVTSKEAAVQASVCATLAVPRAPQ